MKKLLSITLILTFVAFFSFVVINNATARIAGAVDADELSIVGEITTADLGVENPGLLPTNPFYFLKKWGRGIRMFFTFNKVAKIEYELKIANQKIAELKKVDELKPNDTEAFQKALDNYNENVERLQTRLQSLQKTSNNPNVDTLLDRLAEKTLKHQQLLEELKQKHEDFHQELDNVKKDISETLKYAVENLDGPEKIKPRLEKAINAQKESQAKELNAIHFLNIFKENVTSPEIIEELSQLKEKQMNILETKLKSGVISFPQMDGLIEKLNVSGVEVPEVLKRLEKGLDDVNKNPDLEKQMDKLKQKMLDVKKVEPQVCIELYDPVCGVDGKTYSNSCFAKIAHTEVKYKGECGKQGVKDSDSLKFEAVSQPPFINILPDSIKIQIGD